MFIGHKFVELLFKNTPSNKFEYKTTMAVHLLTGKPNKLQIVNKELKYHTEIICDFTDPYLQFKQLMQTLENSGYCTIKLHESYYTVCDFDISYTASDLEHIVVRLLHDIRRLDRKIKKFTHSKNQLKKEQTRCETEPINKVINTVINMLDRDAAPFIKLRAEIVDVCSLVSDKLLRNIRPRKS
jgi:hypothetical protein